jgi:hypothetical protein
MFDMWTQELSEDEESVLISKAASEIKRRKMEMPALLFLEMHKPLSYVGSQAAIVFSPFIVPFLGFDTVNDYSRLLSKRDNVERLIQELEKQDADPEPPKETED